jgi:spermidine synthase
VYFRPGFVSADSSLAFWHEDAQGGVTTVTSRAVGHRTLRTLLTNGKFQGSDGGEALAQTAFATVPLTLRVQHGRALVVGLGTGATAGVVARAGFDAIDIADLSTGVARAAAEQFADLNAHLFERPNVKVFIEDGRNFLLRSTARYDLVTMEITSVWFAGAGNLYSPECYAIAKSRMTERAVLLQWLQFHHIGSDEVASAVAALRQSFTFVSVWWLGEQGMLTGSDVPLEPDPAAIARLRSLPEMAPILRSFELGWGRPLEQIGAARVLGAAGVDRLVNDLVRRGVPVHDDANHYLEYATPRHNLEKADHVAEVLRMLASFEHSAP